MDTATQMSARLAMLAECVADTEDRIADVLEGMAERGGSLAAGRLDRARAARRYAEKERALAAAYASGLAAEGAAG